MHLQKVLSIVVFAVLAGTARGEVIIEHMGNNHPEANGWTLSHGNNATAYPIQNDVGYIDSWRIASGSNGELSYFRSLTPTQHDQAVTLGWALTCIARIETCDTSGAGSAPKLM
jgi:hypothetical protein